MCLVTIISHSLLSPQYRPQIILLLTLPICVLTTHCTATISFAQLYTPPSFGPWNINGPLSHPNTAMFLWPTKQMSFILHLLLYPTHSISFLCSLPSKYCLKLCKRSLHFFHIHYYPGCSEERV